MNTFKLVFALLCLSIYTANADGGADVRDNWNGRNALKKGAKALLFQTTTNYRLGTQIGILGCKYHFSETRIIGLKVGLGYRKNHSGPYESPFERVHKSNGYEWKFELNPEYIIYFKKGITVFPFFSTGILVDYSYGYSEDITEDIVSDDYQKSKVEREVKTWFTGLTSAFGIEAFPVKNISFIIEYRAELIYRSGHSKWRSVHYYEFRSFGDRRSGKSQTTGFDFHYNRLDIGICVYL
jgi:opacity protein-like surface antigen